MYFPVFLNDSELQSYNVKFIWNEPSVSDSVFKVTIAASITSGPMPSAGIEAML